MISNFIDITHEKQVIIGYHCRAEENPYCATLYRVYNIVKTNSQLSDCFLFPSDYEGHLAKICLTLHVSYLLRHTSSAGKYVN